MNAQITFVDKIKKLIAKDDLDSALVELGQFAYNSQWFNESVLHLARFSDLKYKIRTGTILNEETNYQKNKLRLAILELTDEIIKSKDDKLQLDFNKHLNRDTKTEVYDTAELIFNLSQGILKDNQEILIPVIQKGVDDWEVKWEASRKMAGLYLGQNQRGNFRRWIIYLENKGKLNNLDQKTKETISQLTSVVEKLYSVLYTYHRIVKTDEFMYGFRNESEFRYKIDKHIFSRLEDFDKYQIEPLIMDYLENLSGIVEEIGRCTELLKS